MDVQLNDAQLKDIITKAILDSLTPERREALIGEAVKGLLKEVVTGSGFNSDRRSTIQRAFDRAVADVAEGVARDALVGNADVKAKIGTMFTEAWTRLTRTEDGAYDKLVGRVADSMAKGITGERY